MKIVPRKDTGLPLYPDSHYPGPYRKIGVCIHHMAVNTSEPITLEAAKRQTRINYDYHLNRWGAIDIIEGYDLYNVNGEATILECRPWWSNCDAFAGAGKLGNIYIGIEVSGNFDKQIPNPVVIEGLIEMIIWLYNTGKIERLDIKGHRDFNYLSSLGESSCPGANLYSQLNYIRSEVRKRLEKQNKEERNMLRYGSPIATAHHFPDVWTNEFPGQWLHIQVMDKVAKATIKVYATKSNMDGGYYKQIFQQDVVSSDKNPNPYIKFDLAAKMKEAGMENSSISVHAEANGKPINIACAIREFK